MKTSTNLPGIERSHTGFSAAAEEAMLSRIYGGIHYRSSCNDGRAMGIAVAMNVVNNFMRPVHGFRPGQTGHDHGNPTCIVTVK